MPSFYQLEATNEVAKQIRLPEVPLRRARTALFKKFADDEQVLARLPHDKRDAFVARVSLTQMHVVSRHDSRVDGATRLVCRTAEGDVVESVILRTATGRVSLCVSTQSGCAAGCAFCATAQLRPAKSLTASSILEQVTIANRLLTPEQRRVRNIVFMGMGEPFHNEANLGAAIETLVTPGGFAHPPSRVLVSTVGVLPGMIRTAERFPRVNFAISLHATTQAQRNAIIPLAPKYPLEAIRDSIRKLNHIQSERNSVMIEYLMLDQFNDSREDALRLSRFLGDARVHINLIPFNSVEHAPALRSSPQARIESFAYSLRNCGYPTTIRYSLGKDINAACGQLAESTADTTSLVQ